MEAEAETETDVEVEVELNGKQQHHQRRRGARKCEYLFQNKYVDLLTGAEAMKHGLFNPNFAAPNDKRSKFFEEEYNRSHVFCGLNTLQNTDLLKEFGSPNAPHRDLVILVKAPFREPALDMYARKADFDLFIETVRTCHSWI